MVLSDLCVLEKYKGAPVCNIFIFNSLRQNPHWVVYETA